MDWPAASTLARALTMLERAGASGELEASAPEGRAHVLLEGGKVASIDAPTIAVPRIGGLVGGVGQTEADAVERIASGRARGVRLGDAMVRAGMAEGRAVVHALRVQLRARVRAIARWSSLDLRFERGTPPARPHGEPVRPGDLLVGAMREAVEAESPEDVRARLAGSTLALTPLGEALLAGAALWPDEQAVALALRRPLPIEALSAACRGSPRALRLVLALRLLEAAAPPSGASALLARKAQQVRQARSAEELLDLPAGAGREEARRAYKRLTASLHPDRFAAGDQEPIAAVACDVTRALHQAARDLRAAR